MITLYNTLTREKEPFEPLKAGQVSMYVCGPTVYNYIHIGNTRSVVAFDTIRRYLEYRGYDVTYVSNFTDVDDKIIRRAQEEGQTPKEIAEKYIAAFYADTDALNVKRADENPRVVDHMPGIIAFVEDLIQKGYAYESGGDVYFRARKFKDYGHLSAQSLDALRAGASERLENQQQALKEDVLDFALWKKSKAGEPAWEAPWSLGRPGWHIECSEMATKHLGPTIDIHAGGHDLIFPHHENEIAQAEAKTGQTFARYWLHNGFVTIGAEGEKMSKSLGNSVFTHELLKQVAPQAIRFFLASAHYRHPLKFSEENLAAAGRQVERFKAAFEHIKHRQGQAVAKLASDSTWLGQIAQLKTAFEAAMDDDFNTPNGVSVLEEMVKALNQYLDQGEVARPVLAAFEDHLRTWLALYGLEFSKEDSLEADIERLIEERNEARAQRDFAKSDAIRDELKAQGIFLDDTPHGTRWHRGEA